MKNKASNVIWINFKTGRKIDMSNFGYPQKPVQQIPYLCQKKSAIKKIVGSK
jgi:hypothetical protein